MYRGQLYDMIREIKFVYKLSSHTHLLQHNIYKYEVARFAKRFDVTELKKCFT